MHPLEQATLGTTWKSTIEFSSVHSKSLRLLLMVHSGEKSNQCNQCHYVCCDPNALRRHLKTHIREKTSKCNQCQFASHQVGNLRRHLLKGWRKERRTLLHFFVVYDLKGGCFDLFRVEDSKIQTKKWKFQFKHFPVGYLCFPFFGRDFGIFKFFLAHQKYQYSAKYSGKIFGKKSQRIRIWILFGLRKSPEYEYE